MHKGNDVFSPEKPDAALPWIAHADEVGKIVDRFRPKEARIARTSMPRSMPCVSMSLRPKIFWRSRLCWKRDWPIRTTRKSLTS